MMNLPLPKLIQPKQKLENRSCTKACAKNEDLFCKPFGFLNGNRTWLLPVICIFKLIPADPWFHGWWAKDCNLLYFFAKKNVPRNIYSFFQVSEQFSTIDDMDGCKMLLRANGYAFVVRRNRWEAAMCGKCPKKQVFFSLCKCYPWTLF